MEAEGGLYAGGSRRRDGSGQGLIETWQKGQ